MLGRAALSPTDCLPDDEFVTEILLRNGAGVDYVVPRQIDREVGKMYLIHAGRQFRPDTVRLLIESGADFNMVNHKGDRALSAAARTGNVPLLEILLDLALTWTSAVVKLYFRQCTITVSMQFDFCLSRRLI